MVNLNQLENGGEIQDALLDLTGRRTVPNVFIGGKSIGGAEETAALLESGELRWLLVEAGILTVGTEKGDRTNAVSGEDIESGTNSSPMKPFPSVTAVLHHAAVKTRSMEMALAFYSLLGFAPEAKFRAGPARAAWLTNAASVGGEGARIEIIEVPPQFA